MWGKKETEKGEGSQCPADAFRAKANGLLRLGTQSQGFPPPTPEFLLCWFFGSNRPLGQKNLAITWLTTEPQSVRDRPPHLPGGPQRCPGGGSRFY